MEELTIKAAAAVISAAVSAFVMAVFNLSFTAFACAFVGAFIGEVMRKESTFKEVLIVTLAVSILAGWAGAYLIVAYPNTPATTLLGFTGWAFAYFREWIIGLIKDGIAFMFKRKTGQ